MNDIRGEMNAAATGRDATAKRIAGEAKREYVFRKEVPDPTIKHEVGSGDLNYQSFLQDRVRSSGGHAALLVHLRPSASLYDQ